MASPTSPKDPTAPAGKEDEITKRLAEKEKKSGKKAASLFKGFIHKKNVILHGGRRANVRSWIKYFVDLRGDTMVFYDPPLHAELAKPVGGISVQNATVSLYNHTKRKYVFRLNTKFSAEYLFDCATPQETDKWVNSICQVAGQGQNPPDIFKKLNAFPDTKPLVLESLRKQKSTNLVLQIDKTTMDKFKYDDALEALFFTPELSGSTSGTNQVISEQASTSQLLAKAQQMKIAENTASITGSHKKAAVSAAVAASTSAPSTTDDDPMPVEERDVIESSDEDEDISTPEESDEEYETPNLADTGAFDDFLLKRLDHHERVIHNKEKEKKKASKNP